MEGVEFGRAPLELAKAKKQRGLKNLLNDEHTTIMVAIVYLCACDHSGVYEVYRAREKAPGILS